MCVGAMDISTHGPQRLASKPMEARLYAWNDLGTPTLPLANLAMH